MAKGSINSFLIGKSYKRCKRMHELLALVFEILHFESYLTTRNWEEVMGTILQEKKDLESVKYQHLHTSTKEFDELTKDYFLYVSATINGEKGKTAEFWMKYVQLIHVYHEYSRSLREGDLHGYISCLPKFTNMFFALNHPNYARWTVKYHNSLLTLEETHPETFREYQVGMFSINRIT